MIQGLRDPWTILVPKTLVPHGQGVEAPGAPWRLQREQQACSNLPGETTGPAWSWELGQGRGSTGAPATPEGWQSCAGNPSWCPGRQGAGSSSPIHSLSSSHHLANRRTRGFRKIARLGLGGAGEQRRPPRRSQAVCLEVEPDLQWCRGDAGGQDQAEREAHNLSSNSQEGRGLPSSSLWPQRRPARARKWEC